MVRSHSTHPLQCSISLLCWISLVACDPGSNQQPPEREDAPARAQETTALVIKGLTLETPAEFIELEPEIVESFQRRILQMSPHDTEVDVAGRRSPEGMKKGTVHIFRTIGEPLVTERVSVRDWLANEIEGIKASYREQRLRIISMKRTEREGGFELCSVAENTIGAKTARIHGCSLMYFDGNERLVGLAAACTAAAEEASSCRDVIESRVYDVPSSQPMGSLLKLTPVPGLPDIDGRQLAWLEYGMTRDAFRAACRRAGFKVDGYDYAREPFRRAQVKAGHVSQCSGLGEELSIGEVVRVNALFHENALASATLYLNRPLEDVRRDVTRAYPEYIPESGRTLHVINREAQTDDLFSIMTSPHAIEGSSSSVTIMSKRGVVMPPMSPM